jgi:hypothetical protein
LTNGTKGKCYGYVNYRVTGRRKGKVLKRNEGNYTYGFKGYCGQPGWLI